MVDTQSKSVEKYAEDRVANSPLRLQRQSDTIKLFPYSVKENKEILSGGTFILEEISYAAPESTTSAETNRLGPARSGNQAEDSNKS